MTTGVVKVYNESKGFGFIQPDDGGKALFMSRFQFTSGAGTLNAGDKVSFVEQADSQGKTVATNVRLLLD